MAKLTYTTGDATAPVGDGMKIIPHVVNTDGQWGSGFVVALTNKWERHILANRYHQWHRDTFYDVDRDLLDISCVPETHDETQYVDVNEIDFTLGNIQAIKVEDDIIIANMLAQKSTGGQVFDLSGNKNLVLYPLRYSSLCECMLHVAMLAEKHNASIHCPRFGAGLASGHGGGGYSKDVWQNIEDAMKSTWIANDINVTVYDYKG